MSDGLGIALVYAGLLTGLLGLVSLLRPLKFLRIPTRRKAAIVLGLGLATCLLGMALPAPVRRSAGNQLIDRFMPEYHFREVHSILIRAPPDRIFREMQSVTPGEVRWLRTLVWIRSAPARLVGLPVRPSGEPRPLLRPEPGGGSVLLAEEHPRELVLGLVGPFWKPAGGPRPRLEGPQDFLIFDRPDHAKATMSFWLHEEVGGWSRLTTETRVFTPDPSVRRKFAVYWRLIYPGSALIRRMWLEAIKQRAEAAT